MNCPLRHRSEIYGPEWSLDKDAPGPDKVCRKEGRALLTLDLDFSDIRTYPPEDYHGEAILQVANWRAAPQLESVEGLGVVVNYLPYRRMWNLSPVGGLL
jgi:hypothetical protein